MASSKVGGGICFYSFMGLTAGKTHADICRQAFEYDDKPGCWRALPDVPVAQGRLASSAVGGRVYLFGGYPVAPDGAQVSTPDVLAFDPGTNAYVPREPMPVPVVDGRHRSERSRQHRLEAEPVGRIRTQDHSHHGPSGLLDADGAFYTLGGMGAGRQIIGDVIGFTLSKRREWGK